MSELSDQFHFQLKAIGILDEQEYRFHPTRKWRFDFAWPELKIAAEVEGGVWTKGRHVRGIGFVKDCEKYNAAAELGWFVFRFPEGPIHSGAAMSQIERVIKENK